MKSRLLGVVYAFLFSSYSVAAQAATVAFVYSGTITSSTNPSAISVGTPFSGQISYADDLSGAPVPPRGTLYNPVDMSLDIDGQSITFLGTSLAVINDDPTDPFGSGAPPDDWAQFIDFGNYLISGLLTTSFELTFVDLDGNAISDESLLTSFDSFPAKTLAIRFVSNDVVVGGNILFSPVPIPAAAWLFSSGLLGLVGISRRRKSA